MAGPQVVSVTRPLIVDLHRQAHVLLLGALLLSADVGFIEQQFDVFGEAGFDIPTHQGFFESAIQAGYDGIAIIPNGGDPWNALIQTATDAGIPLAASNNTALNSTLDAYQVINAMYDGLTDIERGGQHDGQVRLKVTSDDLVALTKSVAMELAPNIRVNSACVRPCRFSIRASCVPRSCS